MRVYILLFLLIAFLNMPSYSANDTIVLQQGLNGYTGSEDTYVQDGWYVTSHENSGQSPRLLVGYTMALTRANARGLIKFNLESVVDIKNIQRAYISIFMDEDIYASSQDLNPYGNLNLGYLTKTFDPANAIGADYGKYDPVKFLSPPDIIAKTFTDRGDDKRWYNLEIPINDLEDFISGAKPYHGFMLWHRPTSITRTATHKYFISSDNDSLQLRPKLVIIHGDTPVANEAFTLKRKCTNKLLNKDGKNITINGGLPHDLSIYVYDVQGKLIHSLDLSKNSSSLSFNTLLEPFSHGVYFCALHYLGEKHTLKFMIRP